ncbi:MAG: glycine/betaine/sarcosine/D-proline family reductase selenoprotein B, partial [Acidimicrobiales bacterium]
MGPPRQPRGGLRWPAPRRSRTVHPRLARASGPRTKGGAEIARIVHYLNQFFAGVGGEDAAGTPPARTEGAIGPGRKLAQLLGPDHEIVATVSCGDDHAASVEGATEAIVALIRGAGPDLVVAGPAFTSG